MTLEALDADFEKLIKQFPQARRKLVVDCGGKMYEKVLANIDRDVGVKEVKRAKKIQLTEKTKAKTKTAAKKSRKKSRRTGPTGNLRRGVKKVIGSGGGYSAVRADFKVAPHTDLIENGHRIVKNDVVVGWVDGKHMYRNALNEVETELIQDAEKMVNELVGGLFG